MLGDFNAWLRSGLETILPFGFTDSEFKEALNNCYTAICYNKYQKNKLTCPLKLDDVGAVIISYIAYFTLETSEVIVIAKNTARMVLKMVLKRISAILV